MVIECNNANWVYPASSGLFSWLLLAGFLISPSTFASLSDTHKLETGKISTYLMHAVRNIPLIVIATTMCVLGMSGLILLCRKIRDNYCSMKRFLIRCVLAEADFM